MMVAVSMFHLLSDPAQRIDQVALKQIITIPSYSLTLPTSLAAPSVHAPKSEEEIILHN